MNNWFYNNAHTQNAKTYYEISVSEIEELDYIKLLEDTYDIVQSTDYVNVNCEHIA